MRTNGGLRYPRTILRSTYSKKKKKFPPIFLVEETGEKGKFWGAKRVLSGGGSMKRKML